MTDVSVIIPVYNEEHFISKCLDSLISTTSPELSVEYLIAEGNSTDKTREIIQLYIDAGHNIKIIDNPNRFQTHGLNLAIKQAHGDYIIRCDAHTIYPPNYIIDLVRFLRSDAEHKFGNIGLKAVTIPPNTTDKALSISLILSSPIGVGPSHRSIEVKKTSPVDTLLFGAWRKSIFDEVGLFDEQFIRGQDYEHNIRIKKAGYTVALIPGDEIQYISRDSLTKLSKMIFQYAHAKGAILKKHGKIPNVRSFAPLALISYTPLGITIDYAWIPYIAYICIVSIASIHMAIKAKRPGVLKYLIVGIPLAHASHAAGLFKGLFDLFIARKSYLQWDSTR